MKALHVYTNQRQEGSDLKVIFEFEGMVWRCLKVFWSGLVLIWRCLKCFEGVGKQHRLKSYRYSSNDVFWMCCESMFWISPHRLLFHLFPAHKPCPLYIPYTHTHVSQDTHRHMTRNIIVASGLQTRTTDCSTIGPHKNNNPLVA